VIGARFPIRERALRRGGRLFVRREPPPYIVRRLALIVARSFVLSLYYLGTELGLPLRHPLRRGVGLPALVDPALLGGDGQEPVLDDAVGGRDGRRRTRGTRLE
jgi:hypothetical protein